jgi:hypothetical protein
MFYVGLDIHAKHIAMCVLTEVGRIYRRCQVRTIDEMMQTLESCQIGSKSATKQAAATATITTSCGRWPHESLSHIPASFG